jgi:hypothetical protein
MGRMHPLMETKRRQSNGATWLCAREPLLPMDESATELVGRFYSSLFRESRRGAQGHVGKNRLWRSSPCPRLCRQKHVML